MKAKSNKVSLSLFDVYSKDSCVHRNWYVNSAKYSIFLSQLSLFLSYNGISREGIFIFERKEYLFLERERLFRFTRDTTRRRPRLITYESIPAVSWFLSFKTMNQNQE